MPTPLELEDVKPVLPEDGSQDEPLDLLSPHWPLRLSVGILLYAVLVGALVLPLILSGAGGVETALAVVPCVVAATFARLLCPLLAARSRPGALRPGVVAAALLASCAATGFVVAASAMVGAEATVRLWLGGGAVVFATLVVAAGLRARELRVGAASRRIFFVGSAAQLADLRREVDRRGDMRVVGSLLCSRDGSETLADSVAASAATTLVLSSEAARDEGYVAAASSLHLGGLRVRALNDFYERHFGKVALSDLSHAWFLFDVAEIHRPRLYRRAKRILESSVAAVMLIVLAPILPAIALLVRRSSPGPILFRQQRVGLQGRVVTLTKFRTMTVAAPGAIEGWATEHAVRITPIGRRLRQYRLDEVPQLWSVVRGDLALVGPRPEQPHLVERLSEQIEFYGARHRVRPGLTGWAQVNADYGGSVRGTLAKLQYDFFYIKRQSLRLDLLILFATVRTVLSGRGS